VFNDKTGDLVSLKVLDDNLDVMMITDNGIVIRVHAEEISRIGRNTQGVRIMRLKNDKANVVSVALAPYEEEAPEVEYDEDGNPIVEEVVDVVEAPATAEGETNTEIAE
jgi:DNA gyrase subunit A